jgi:hypothetical protein|tara:strand:- start:182 stop:1087 length:906 start_codon:yes stop_codon:yes gene_type:complete
MNLVVCGCSWSSRDPNHLDTEYGYYISKHFGWDYQNIARPACDNFGIRLQIDYAIKELKADFIIVNWTTPCRICWNNTGKDYSIFEGLKQLDYDVENIKDDGSQGTFTRHSHPLYPNDTPVITSQSLVSILENNLTCTYEEACYNWWMLAQYFTSEQFYAFRKWYIYMYDHDLEAHKQLYIMQSAVEQMQRAKIPYLFCPNTFTFKQTETNLKQPDHNNRQTISIAETQHNTNNYLWDFVPEENMLNEGISSALQGDHRRMKEQNLEHEPGGDYTHHLSPQAQEEWSNDHAIPKITSLLNL